MRCTTFQSMCQMITRNESVSVWLRFIGCWFDLKCSMVGRYSQCTKSQSSRISTQNGAKYKIKLWLIHQGRSFLNNCAEQSTSTHLRSGRQSIRKYVQFSNNSHTHKLLWHFRFNKSSSINVKISYIDIIHKFN